MIYEKYCKLIKYAAWKYSSRYYYLEYNELICIGNLAFTECVGYALKYGNRRFPHSRFKSSLWYAMLNARRNEGKKNAIHVEINDYMAVDMETYSAILTGDCLKNIGRYLNEKDYELVNVVIGNDKQVDRISNARVKRKNRLYSLGILPRKPKGGDGILLIDICERFNISSYSLNRWICRIRKIFLKYNLVMDII